MSELNEFKWVQYIKHSKNMVSVLYIKTIKGIITKNKPCALCRIIFRDFYSWFDTFKSNGVV